MRVSRRDLLAAAAYLAGGAAAARPVPGARLWAQAARPTVAPGKENLLVRSLRPPDYETPVALLDSWLTPVENFYVRSHLPVPPNLDPAAWTLQVEGEVTTPLALSMDDIRRMPPTTLTATLECAGNGRAFFDPPVAGIQWGKGAVGTARWTGVRMADVLKRAGVRPSGRFVLLNGADRALGTMPDFIRQVPIDKATHADTLIAYEMNGQPLPPVHGYPLRAIIPGWEGAYAVKWLTTLRLVAREFDGFWVATAYRYPIKQVAPGAAVDAKDMAPLTGLVVKSLITRPTDGAVLPPGKVDVAGFAWAGETAIARVEVSSDNGASWQPARLTGENARYTWRRFEAQVAAAKPESLLIMARATDGDGRTQPMSPPWNPSGYLWNAPDSVRVEIK
jgi:DMSO/TMAO reductase YedYZ molybdopterin-dependent catalytic subunit